MSVSIARLGYPEALEEPGTAEVQFEVHVDLAAYMPGFSIVYKDGPADRIRMRVSDGVWDEYVRGSLIHIYWDGSYDACSSLSGTVYIELPRPGTYRFETVAGWYSPSEGYFYTTDRRGFSIEVKGVALPTISVPQWVKGAALGAAGIALGMGVLGYLVFRRGDVAASLASLGAGSFLLYEAYKAYRGGGGVGG